MKKINMIFSVAVMTLMAIACQTLDEGMADNAQDAPEVGESPEVGTTEGVVLFGVLPASRKAEPVSQPKTRTTLNEDFTVSWYNTDQLAVFNAPTGTEEYSDNLHFIIDDAATGKFAPYSDKVDVPFEEGVNYDWYVCHPYRIYQGSPELKTPKGETNDDGYFPIGYTTQTGYNSSSHISSTDVIVGKALNTREPVIKFKHLAVLHKFTVTNNSDKPTVITELTLNGGENAIFGTFRIDLTSDNPVIDPSNANNTFNERSLTINDGDELAVGESADFYMITAPFTLNIGEIFTITIETTTGTQSLEKVATQDIEFLAGTYNTANLVYDYIPHYADHLYYDTFYDSSSNLASNTTFNEGSMSARWKSYLADLSGLSVYDGEKSAISYSYENCQPSRQESTALVGMDEFHLWFKENSVAYLTISGIKLHGNTDLNLSFVQTYRSSGLKLEYSVDGGTNWVEIGTTALSASAYAYNASFDFSVAEGSETISLRFTRTQTAPRIDNIKLTWQE